jgi:hypothetical protein
MEAGKYNQADMLYRRIMDHSEPNSLEAEDARCKIKSLRSRPKTKRHPKYGLN